MKGSLIYLYNKFRASTNYFIYNDLSNSKDTRT